MTHVFRCYFWDAHDAVEVEASGEREAQGLAAGKRGWPAEKIIARYVKTLADQPYDARDAELRKGLVK